MQQTAIRVLEAAFTGYPVKDMKRARHFYETILNLKPTSEPEGDIWIEYDLNGCTLGLWAGGEETWSPSTNGPSLALEVDDYEQTMATLRAEGVPILMDTIDTPVCRMSVIGDPEGNSLIIHKLK